MLFKISSTSMESLMIVSCSAARGAEEDSFSLISWTKIKHKHGKYCIWELFANKERVWSWTLCGGSLISQAFFLGIQGSTLLARCLLLAAQWWKFSLPWLSARWSSHRDRTKLLRGLTMVKVLVMMKDVS